MDKPNQRKGSTSNSHVGRAFENAAQAFWKSQGLELERDLKVPVGVGNHKKDHAFDLGCHQQKVLIECKSHTWTEGNNVPSAKMTTWNEAMYYFAVSPSGYRKVMFVLRDVSARRELTLAQYYLDRYKHLVPADVEFWEYDEATKQAKQLKVRTA